MSTNEALIERLRNEAQIHAQEARTANATIAEIYRIVTEGTGEPGRWNGAEPVRKCIEELRTALAAAPAADAVASVADERAAFDAWFWLEPECKGDCWEAWQARAAQPQQATLPASSTLADDLDAVYAAFRIGKNARTLGTLLINIENALRRTACLNAIEREFFMVPTPPEPEDDGVPGEECLLRWGQEPADYVTTFREALATISATRAQPQADAAEPEQADPLADLRAAVAFTDQVRAAGKRGEETMANGAFRDSREWLERAARTAIAQPAPQALGADAGPVMVAPGVVRFPAKDMPAKECFDYDNIPKYPMYTCMACQATDYGPARITHKPGCVVHAALAAAATTGGQSHA